MYLKEICRIGAVRVSDVRASGGTKLALRGRPNSESPSGPSSSAPAHLPADGGRQTSRVRTAAKTQLCVFAVHPACLLGHHSEQICATLYVAKTINSLASECPLSSSSKALFYIETKRHSSH